MKHVIKLPSRGQISVWTDNDLKHIDTRDPHEIKFYLGLCTTLLTLPSSYLYYWFYGWSNCFM